MAAGKGLPFFLFTQFTVSLDKMKLCPVFSFTHNLTPVLPVSWNDFTVGAESPFEGGAGNTGLW